MCDTCGCNVTPGNRGRAEAHVHPHGTTAVEVLEDLLHENDHQAARNREHFDAHGVLAVNLMSAPGAGKTRLLETTLRALAGRFRIAVIEGDLETENDAERIRAAGVPAVQITTGTACHLDAHLVHGALHDLDLEAVDIVFIENVGNLVCPASFDLGHHRSVVLLSAPEGDDKPAKYPVMFRAADLVVLSKSDLLPVLEDFSPRRAEAAVRRLANPAPVLCLSVRRPETLGPWLAWLERERAAVAARRPHGGTQRHDHPGDPGAPSPRESARDSADGARG